MINKRLLIKNLLAHNDENSFYDKKRKLNIGEKEGKAKFLKHI
ncbi:MAG: ATP-binding protein, partial [Kordia sp.]